MTSHQSPQHPPEAFPRRRPHESPRPESASANDSHPVRELMKRHPWRTASAVWCLFWAVLTLCGLSVSSAWTGLITGLLVIIAVWMVACLWRKHRERAADTTDKDDPSSSWQLSAAFFMGLVVATFARTNHDNSFRGVNFRPDLTNRDMADLVQRQSPVQAANDRPDLAKRATSTQRYWKTTVAELHPYRFGVPDSDEPADLYFERQIDAYATAVKRAREAPQSGVAPDVLSMVSRHLVFDEMMIEWARRVQEESPARQPEQSNVTATDQFHAFEEYLRNMTDDQLAEWPPEHRELLEQFFDLNEMAFEQLRDIEIMQARLTERFSGYAFPLPDVNLYESVN